LEVAINMLLVNCAVLPAAVGQPSIIKDIAGKYQKIFGVAFSNLSNKISRVRALLYGVG